MKSSAKLSTPRNLAKLQRRKKMTQTILTKDSLKLLIVARTQEGDLSAELLFQLVLLKHADLIILKELIRLNKLLSKMKLKRCQRMRPKPLCNKLISNLFFSSLPDILRELLVLSSISEGSFSLMMKRKILVKIQTQREVD